MSPMEFAALANAVTLSAFALATPGLHTILEDQAVDARLPIARARTADEIEIVMPAAARSLSRLVLRQAGRDTWLVIAHEGFDGPFPAASRHGVSEMTMSRDAIVDRLRRFARAVGEDILMGDAMASRRAA